MFYSVNTNEPNPIKIEQIVDDVIEKIVNNKFDKINIFEKWIIRLLVRENIKKKADVIEQRESWMFRQG